MEPQLSQADLEVICEVARAHSRLLDRLEQALKNGDTLLALQLARQVCGLPEEQKN